MLDAVPEAEHEVRPVLFGQDRKAKRGARKVDALVILDHAARGDATLDVVAPDVLDVERDPAVVDQDVVANLHVAGEAPVGDAGPLGRPDNALRGQHERVFGIGLLGQLLAVGLSMVTSRSPPSWINRALATAEETQPPPITLAVRERHADWTRRLTAKRAWH